eukprot:2475574-Prymnesium_polylepis.1
MRGWEAAPNRGRTRMCAPTACGPAHAAWRTWTSSRRSPRSMSWCGCARPSGHEWTQLAHRSKLTHSTHLSQRSPGCGVPPHASHRSMYGSSSSSERYGSPSAPTP